MEISEKKLLLIILVVVIAGFVFLSIQMSSREVVFYPIETNETETIGGTYYIPKITTTTIKGIIKCCQVCRYQCPCWY